MDVDVELVFYRLRVKVWWCGLGPVLPTKVTDVGRTRVVVMFTR